MDYLFLVLILCCVVFLHFIPVHAYLQGPTSSPTPGELTVVTSTEGKKQQIVIPSDKLLFDVTPHTDTSGKVVLLDVKLNQSLSGFYRTVGFPRRTHSVVFVYPIFTQAAYGSDGFYDYYNKRCDRSCLTVQIPHNFHGVYQSSIGGAFILRLLNYSYITDIDVDKNPDILKRYQTVIVLHNEYVTKREFDAITSHPHVIYLYPNALYAQVIANYTSGTITLVRGHGYPTPHIRNGFGWRYDNSQYEYNVACNNWSFESVGNGKISNCYPDYRVLYDATLLKTIKDLSVHDMPEFGTLTGTIMLASVVVMVTISKSGKIHF